MIIVGVFSLGGCTKKDTNYAKLFKEDYESLNGEKNARGVEHRKVNINEKYPFIEVTAKDIVEKIDNKETFYVYFGSKLCPWCRSVIEKATEVANDYGIDKIYYVDAWDDEGNEILRDKYEVDDNGNTKLLIEGTNEYFKLLESFKDLLPEYEIKGDEKRIFLPTFIYVKNGVALKMTDGISELQKDAREELTQEILKQEQEEFEDLFTEFCDSSC